MKLMRKGFDATYDMIRNYVFRKTQDDPERAHELFVRAMRGLYATGLERVVLDAKLPSTKFQIANAAGFNKNAEIPPQVLAALGFERGVIGTVMCEGREGNERPRMWRFPKTESLVNYLGLPSDGVYAVSDRLRMYGKSPIPLTINLMTLKDGVDGREEIEEIILETKDIPCVDRYELNIACPNTRHSVEEFLAQANGLVTGARRRMDPGQKLYVKVSPDMDAAALEQVAALAIDGYTTTNTTTNHDPQFITSSPGKGGASGNAVVERSRYVQMILGESGKPVIACGGINSVASARERIEDGASEIQICTGLVYKGTRLIRELREGLQE